MAWARSGDVPARPLLAGIARRLGPSVAARDEVDRLDVDGVDGFPPMPDDAGPDLLGLAHEALLVPADRRVRGAHYTPPALADRLVALTLAAAAPPRRLLDPACGGGAFLLAAGRALVGADGDRRRAVAALHGVEIDPLAAQVARTATALWSGGPAATVAEGDFLGGVGPQEVDAVVGNPPFLTPLRRATAPAGPGPGAYTDAAGRFLLRALDVVAEGGRVGLVQPQSVLAARDAGPVRAAVAERGALRALWVAGAPVFAAHTRVVAVVVESGGAPGPVALHAGPDVAAVGTAAPGPWASLAARARGVPEVVLRSRRTVGDEASVVAGFRAQYYGVVDHVTDRGTGAPLVTAGLVDPGRCHWGQRRTRVGGRWWEAPTVAVEGLDDDVRAWMAARLVPKLVVATQTRVLEVAVDEAGTWLPAVPVLSVEADAERLWPLAAALSSPAVTAWALDRATGTALATDAVRVTADLVRSAPLPTDEAAWAEATAAFRAGDLSRFAEAACRAHEVAPALAAWWVDRLPAD